MARIERKPSNLVLETETQTETQTIFYFGFVAHHVQQNWYAHATIKSIGTFADADKFYSENQDKAHEESLDWFFYPCE